jgi:hypothetical protein
MQFVESSIIGLRAAYHRLSAGPTRPEVCVFPMIHIGAPAYYAEVKRRLDTCDVILFEGVRSFRSWLLTRAYAIPVRRKRLGLVLQRDALPLRGRQEKIHADVSSAEFSSAWRAIPLYQRAVILIAAPLYGVWLYFTASRRSIAKGRNVEEVRSDRELAIAKASPELEDALLATRDERLVEDLSAAIDTHDAGNRIGVVYGAAHMRVVTRLLAARYQYRVVESEWMMVFDLDE